METKTLLKRMFWLLGTTVVLLMVILVTGSSLVLKKSTAYVTPLIDLSKEELTKRSEYLVNTSACHDCHSPKVMTPNRPEPDPDRLLSGHPSYMPLAEINTSALKDWVLFDQHLTAIAGPWGVSFTAISLPMKRGIGNWTEEQFFRAMRDGKYKGLEVVVHYFHLCLGRYTET